MSINRQIQLPEKMQNLKLDKRGFPIPYIILIDAAGTPHFKINDITKVNLCLRWNFCAICGKSMKKDMWCIGGPGSAFHSQGAYIDTPTHYECGKYALQVCPYLASKNYNTYAIEDKVKAVVAPDEGLQIYVDPTVNPDRPKVFIFSHITSYRTRGELPERYLIPDRPYLEIEYWDKGQRLDESYARSIIFSQGYTIPEDILKNDE